jgi:dienelactone hydrolase
MTSHAARPRVWVVLLAMLAGTSPSLCAETRVPLVTSDGVALVGTYYEAARQPSPTVLLLHMPTRNRADWREIGRRLAERGVGALALDLRGHGESASDPAAVASGGLQASVADVRAGLAWLKGRPESIPGHIGVMGASLGANLAALGSAEDPGVRALVLLSATLDFRGLRTEAALRQYGARPALLVASQEDAYAMRSLRTLSAAGAGLREVRVLDGAGHGTTMFLHQPDLAGSLVDWLYSRLL